MTDAKKPPAFYCPSCGQKHRTNLDPLVGKPGAVIRLACRGCKVPLALRLDAQDQPACALEDVAAPSPAPAPTPEEPKPAAPVVARRKRDRGGAPAPSRRRARDKPASVAGATPPRTAAAEDASPPEGSRSSPSLPSPDLADIDPTPKSGHGAAKAIDAEFRSGEHIGRYAIEEAVGQGGTSTVYKAFDPTTNRSVALKVLRNGADDVMRTRFLREIEVQANIRHQNIMPVFDRGTLPDGRPFFTMELLYDPWSLAEIIERRDEGTLGRYAAMKKLGDLEALIRDVLLPVADGVYVANVENGVVHRDLKPDNVLVDSRTLRPYVIDFGICQVLEKKSGIASKAVIPPTTEEEGIVGTPRFLAPEQVKGNVHARTDVWGLGATLFAVIAGEPPIATAQNISKAELTRRIEALESTKKKAVERDDERKIALCDEQLVRLTDPGLRTVDDLFRDARDGKYSDLPATTPSPLKAVVKKAMSVSPTDRYVNARQLATELQSWLSGKSVRALVEVGGTAAAVETARRAVRTHLVTLLWILGGLGLGLLIAKGTASSGATPPSTRVADAEADIQLLSDNLDGLVRVADSLTAVERNRLWSALDERAALIETRLSGEPDGPRVTAMRERLGFVRDRFAPPRIRIEAPTGLALKARNAITDAAQAVRIGENSLPPGAYEVTGPDALRFPIEVPLVIRDQQAANRFATEPPIETLEVPVSPDAAPSGMVLVLGGRVLARDLPFNAPSTAATKVPAFFMDAAEVTNSEYAQFLRSVPLEERKARMPTSGFIPDPEQSGAPIVTKGREDVPVVDLRPEDAAAYCTWRSKQAGRTVRLPSEAEWVLAAGATLGHHLADGSRGERTDAEFASPLRQAGAHAKDVSPYGVRGLLGNAREMVTSSVGDLDAGAVLVKGAGVGDDPDRGAIYIHRVLPAGAREAVTGFRCVQEIPAGEAGGR